MIVQNTARYTRYYDAHSDRFLEVGAAWTPDVIRRACLDAHIHNAEVTNYSLEGYRPVIHGLYPVPPRSSWVINRESVKQARRTVMPFVKGGSIERIEGCASRLIRSFGSPSIAVEFSGGLDSALILAILYRIGVRPILIGSRWSGYEFRTERAVQDALAAMYPCDAFIQRDSPLPFAELLQMPRHILPDEVSLLHARHSYNAKICNSAGIDVVLCGNGGDSLLCNAQNIYDGRVLFEPWTWEIHWANEHIYSRSSCRLISGFSLPMIASNLCALRADRSSIELEDRYKLAARNIFSDILPKELSNYFYKASFGGVFLEGLYRSSEDIELIFREAGKIHPDKRLNPDFFRNNMENYSLMDSNQNKAFFAVINFACWIYSNLNN